MQVTFYFITHKSFSFLKNIHNRAHKPYKFLRSHRLFCKIKRKTFIHCFYRGRKYRLIQKHCLHSLRHIWRKFWSTHKTLFWLWLYINNITAGTFHKFQEHILDYIIMLHLACWVFQPVVIVIHKHDKTIFIEHKSIYKLIIIKVINRKT